jgi:hypothetical protein
MLTKDTPDNILPQVSGNFFRAFVPKTDAAAVVDNVNARLQFIEDVLVDFRIIQFGHATTPRGIIGQNGNKFSWFV